MLPGADRSENRVEIWPAIDLRGGKCVRLQQGDYQRETVFGDDPAAMARHWVARGAEHLHLVDLDGARDGRVTNLAGVRAIVESVGVDCELGGGIRDEAAIRQLLDLGLDRLVIGTLAIEQPEWFRRMCRKYPGRLALGIDAREGRVAVRGWKETSAVAAAELARQFAGVPLAAVIYTDIAADGMLTGPNYAGLAEMLGAADAPLVASGGVARKEDVARLAAVPVAGCIIGRALYEGTLSLPDALAAARGATHSSLVKGTIMAKYPVADLRNIAFCGHGSAGKTTLVDRILVATGMFNRPASVEEGTSICDFDDEEKQHKYSIEASVVHFDHDGKRFQVIDTPGYPDFIGQTIGALRAVDTGGGGHQRPVGHRGQHPAGVRRSEEGRPGTPRRAQQDGRREHRLPRPAGAASRSCSARRACW